MSSYSPGCRCLDGTPQPLKESGEQGWLAGADDSQQFQRHRLSGAGPGNPNLRDTGFDLGALLFGQSFKFAFTAADQVPDPSGPHGRDGGARWGKAPRWPLMYSPPVTGQPGLVQLAEPTWWLGSTGEAVEKSNAITRKSTQGDVLAGIGCRQLGVGFRA